MDMLQGNLFNLNNNPWCDTYFGSHAIQPDWWTPSFKPHDPCSNSCNGWLTSRHDLCCSGKLPSLREHRPRSSPIGKGGEAYFSPRPPIAPMHVVFTMALPPDQGSVKVHLKPKLPHLDEIPFTLGGSMGVGHSTEIVPPVFIVDSTKLLASATAHTATSCSNSQGPGRVPKLKRHYSQKAGSGDMVRLLLEEFITSLPLFTPDTKVSTNDMAVETPDIPQVPSFTQRRLRRRRLSSSNQSHSSVAVQAPLANEKSASHDYEGVTSREALSEEWVGGVRALRDSHVRLVLHQLRHIDRLNRALDRTFRPRSRPRLALRLCT